MSSIDNVEASEFKENISECYHKYIRPGDTLVRFLFVIEMEEATGDLATALVALKECRDFQQGSELRYGKIYEGTFVSGRRN